MSVPSPYTKVVEVDGKMNLHITRESGNAGIMFGGTSISSTSEGLVFQLNENEHFSIQSTMNEPVLQINETGTVPLQLEENQESVQENKVDTRK
jgi:hypothetical protein